MSSEGGCGHIHRDVSGAALMTGGGGGHIHRDVSGAALLPLGMWSSVRPFANFFFS